MKLDQFEKGDVIYRALPRKWWSPSGWGLMGTNEQREDRSYMDEPFIFSEIKGNICALLKPKDLYLHKLEMDIYNDDNWNFYPVFEQEQFKFPGLVVDVENDRYIAVDFKTKLEAPK